MWKILCIALFMLRIYQNMKINQSISLDENVMLLWGVD